MKIDFPHWNEFTPEKVQHDLPRLLSAAERDVAALEAAQPKTYEDFVWALNRATRELWQTWGCVAHMLGVMNSEAWRAIEADWQPKVVAFSLRVSQSKRLYEIARNLRAEDPTRQRVLSKMVQAAELAGVGLEGADQLRFNEIQARLAKLGSDFQNAVIDATRKFRYEKDGKTYTIDDANYPETMKHCSDRAVRECLYRARVTRAPENRARIDEILSLRYEAAHLLGFANPAEASLATKSAPSITAVMKMIDDLDQATAARAKAEELSGEPWDLAYEAERLRERQYNYSEEDLKRYLELEDVVQGLFRLTKFLFDVEIEEVVGDAKPAIWHEDVRFFRVRERGEIIAHFYFDPFVRSGLKSGGAWMNEFRNRRRAFQKDSSAAQDVELPLAVIVTNFPCRDEKGMCYLPLREVETLFHEFGHALQCLLTRVDEEDAAGINLVEWDAVEVASQFMENWCLNNRTGITIPADLKTKVRAAKNFRAATACRRQLAFAKTDLLLHSSQDSSPTALKNKIFTHFGLPLIPEDQFLCAFTHIFAGGYAAGYYGYKWAEVMSADCYGAFEEVGLDHDAELQRMGRLYRETILALGGSSSARDVFRKFRGRDPEISAMIRQQDLV